MVYGMVIMHGFGNGGDLNSMATNNPVSMLEQRTDKSNANRIYGNFQVDYKLHFLPDLSC